MKYQYTYLLKLKEFDSQQVSVHVEDELAPGVELSQQLSMPGGDTVEDTGVPSVNIIQINHKRFIKTYKGIKHKA
jgi:hypothetical protein